MKRERARATRWPSCRHAKRGGAVARGVGAAGRGHLGGDRDLDVDAELGPAQELDVDGVEHEAAVDRRAVIEVGIALRSWRPMSTNVVPDTWLAIAGFS